MGRIFSAALLGCLGCSMAIAPAIAETESKQTVFGSITLQQGFSPDPRVLRGVSGGDRKASSRLVESSQTGECLGYIDQHPDHRLELKSFFNYLKVAVKSDGDTVLAIKGPGGVWCNDDSHNQNPVIAGEWQAGLYQVWVGSRNRGEFHGYSLNITQVK